MAMPAPHEPAFIVNSKLGADAEYSPKAASKECLTLSPECRSRSNGSTSPGSMSPLPSTLEGESECSALPEYAVLPEYDYPVPVFVRNTFIETGIGRPLSLDEFFMERRVQSCPMPSPPGLFASEDGSLAMPAPVTIMDSVMAAAASASAAAAAATRCWMRPLTTPAVPCSPPLNSSAPILSLANALAEPELGSPENPTVGSTGHRLGNCKPCAFYHTKGCGNGTQCPFCHICPAGEKKRRQKVKGIVQREVKRMGFM